MAEKIEIFWLKIIWRCIMRLISNGYDDMNQLLNMTSSEHVEVCKDLGFFHMIGHRKRFLAVIRIASRKLKNQLVKSIYFSTC